MANKELHLHGELQKPQYIDSALSSKKVVAEFVPRIQELQALVGTYTCEEPPLYRAYKASKSKLRYSRWLAALGLSEIEVKSAVEASKPTTYTLSTRYTDILRCSLTKHFQSCYHPTGCNSHIPYGICMYFPQIGIVYTRNKAGHFSNRFFVGLGQEPVMQNDRVVPGPWILYLYRPYGEITTCVEIAHDLRKRLSSKKIRVCSDNCPNIKSLRAYAWNNRFQGPDEQFRWLEATRPR